MNPFLIALIIAVWLFVLTALRRAKLQSWHFLWGSMGLFVILMLVIEPIAAQPLARVVSALSGAVGNFTGAFTAYFKYGILFITTDTGSLTMTVDFECSGIIEVLAFLSLLIFFDVYTTPEKLLVGISGFAAIIFCNAVRITMICLVVHYAGMPWYYIMHTFVGRLFFYGCSVLLYFYVFTKPQIIKMKVGSFAYDHAKNNS